MKTIFNENSIKLIALGMCGCGNGYVLIPKGHSMYGKSYAEINDFISIHGGVTYSEEITRIHLEVFDDLTTDDIGMWIVGFDTCHADDSPEKWTKEKVLQEADRLREQLEQIK